MFSTILFSVPNNKIYHEIVIIFIECILVNLKTLGYPPEF